MEKVRRQRPGAVLLAALMFFSVVSPLAAQMRASGVVGVPTSFAPAGTSASVSSQCQAPRMLALPTAGISSPLLPGPAFSPSVAAQPSASAAIPAISAVESSGLEASPEAGDFVQPSVAATSKESQPPATRREASARRLVSETTTGWTSRSAGDPSLGVPAEASEGALATLKPAAPASSPASKPSVPSPESILPQPRAAKIIYVAGLVLVAAATPAFIFPALLNAALFSVAAGAVLVGVSAVVSAIQTPKSAPPPDPSPEPSWPRPLAAKVAHIVGSALMVVSAFSIIIPTLVPVAFVSVVTGSALVAGSIVIPEMLPPALVAIKGVALWAGLGSLSLSRFWRQPGSGVESPRGPPAAEPKGWFSSFKIAWATAKSSAADQPALESRVGGSSIKAFRDWFLGGLRAAGAWIPLALAAMAAGWLVKPLDGMVHSAGEVGIIPFDAVLNGTLGSNLLGFIASSLAAQAVTLAVFDRVRVLAGRLGAGRAAGWIAGAVATAVSAALILPVSMLPSVVVPMIAIEAALLWLRVRSNSWLAPLALRGIMSLFFLEAARLTVRLAMGPIAILAGLPAVWTGVAVAGMLLAALAYSASGVGLSALGGALKAQFQRVREFGQAWRSPSPDGAPKSPWALLKLASLWGLVTYAVGDVFFSVVHAMEGGGVEPTPAILVQVLSAPMDMVLFNFLLVGFLEEYVFRRGFFKPFVSRLEKWGLNGRKVFWIAAVASSLIFSLAHYVDFGALLAKLGVGAVGANGLSVTYQFSLAGFLTRVALGMLLAWLYAASGTIFLPILAHFFADSLEGLGLRFGFIPFLAMAAAVLLVQRAWKSRRSSVL